jgi:capsular exopolysaccharide synthesis family protein
MYYNLLREIQSDHILELTAKHLGLGGRHGYIRKRYCKDVKVKLNSERNLQVDILSYDFDIGAAWPQAMFETYEEYRRDRVLERMEHQFNSWKRDFAKVKEKIAVQERKLRDLVEEEHQWELQMGMSELRKVPDDLIATKQTLELFGTLDKALKDPNIDRDSRLSIFQRAQENAKVEIGEIVPGMTRRGKTEVYPQQGSSVILLPDMVKSSKEGWQLLDEDVKDLRAELERKRKVFKDAHPEIIEIQQKLGVLEEHLDRDVLSMQNKFYAQSKLLEEKKAVLEKKLVRLKDLKIKSDQFLNAKQRIEGARAPWEIQLKRLENNMGVFDASKDRELFALLPPEILSLDEKPIVPDLKKTAMLLVALSLFLGLGVPFLLEYLDNTYSVIEDAEKDLDLPNLGIVPRIHVPDDKLNPSPGESPRIVQETFRMIRTNLVTKSDFGEKRQVIMVTSSLPREGKSMFSLNLAESFARLGEQTLLMDMDLRRGRLNRALNIPREPGITEMLMNPEENAMNYCQKTHLDMLSLLPGGQRIENVAEVLASTPFGDFMNRCRCQYERIIVDVPPALGLAETTGVLPLVDGVVMVVWSGYTPCEQVKAAVNQLRSNGANFYGFVLNQLDLKCPTNYFRYYYFSDYYYTSYK